MGPKNRRINVKLWKHPPNLWECFENTHITYILEKSTHIKFRISVDHINAFHRKLMQ